MDSFGTTQAETEAVMDPDEDNNRTVGVAAGTQSKTARPQERIDAARIQGFLLFYPWNPEQPEVETEAQVVELSESHLQLVSPVSLHGGGSVFAQLRVTSPGGWVDRRTSRDSTVDLNGVVVSSRPLEEDWAQFRVKVMLDTYCIEAVQTIREHLSR